MQARLEKRLAALEAAPALVSDKWRQFEYALWVGHGDPDEPFVFDPSIPDSQRWAELEQAIDRAYGDDLGPKMP